MFGMGFGFALALMVLGSVRELLGSGYVGAGTPFQFRLLGEWFRPMVVMILPAGAFISLGVMVGIFRWISPREG